MAVDDVVDERAPVAGARVQRVARVALLVYVATASLALLAPTSGVQEQIAQQVSDLGVRVGFSPELASEHAAEALLNVAVLAPLPVLGSLLWPAVRWWQWCVGGLAVSVGMELAQALLLPQRVPSTRDVFTNTLGAWTGAVLGSGIRRLVTRSGPRQS